MSPLESADPAAAGVRHRARHEAAGLDTDTREPDPAGVPPARGRAGRNLPAAIGVGLGLGGVVLASLLFWRPGWVFVVAAGAVVAVWEMVRAIGHNGQRAPLLPLLAGSGAMIALAWYAGAEGLTLGLVLTVLAAMVWRLADGPAGYQRDLLAAVLIAVYVPFLGSFAVLLDKPHDGVLRVIVMLAAVVMSDTGGYAAGVFLGKHPMAPSVSPKKSWEGTAGSVVTAAIGTAILFALLFHVAWWRGAIFGAGVAAAAVLGDLAESLVKRDLRVKDMSSLLPGHGGLMDRIDSVLFAAPVGFVLFSMLVPPS